ncbi:hypothetical protein SH611_13320 [Geminicoccaceae bacterium 1502E]|nr:hypothetical protein [Geminicoccaceae bacterium 1502E]
MRDILLPFLASRWAAVISQNGVEKGWELSAAGGEGVLASLACSGEPFVKDGYGRAAADGWKGDHAAGASGTGAAARDGEAAGLGQASDRVGTSALPASGDGGGNQPCYHQGICEG